MKRQFLKSQQDAARSAAAFFRSPLDLRAIDGNDAELASDEESVSEDEKQKGDEAENGFYVISLPLSTAPTG